MLFICEMEKEDFEVSLKSIKEKARDWWVTYDEKLWAKHILVYLLFLSLWSVVFALIFHHSDFFNTEADSARYMLSALVQSQAAIVAIVVSLTLIAVQFTASAYSPRVIDIFKSPKQNPDFWILIGFYGVSIFYGLLLLKLVEGATGELVSQSAIWPSFYPLISLEHGVSIAYWLGAFTFIIIVPYLWTIMDLLKPERIINRLAIEINKDNLVPTKIKITPGKNLKPKEDPIQPIMDIVHGSIMKYDLETTRVGLKAVTERVIEIIDQDSQISISSFFCSRLRSVGSHAISQADEDATIEVIVNLGNFGKSTAEKRLPVATKLAVTSLGDIGVAAAEKGVEEATRIAAGSLGEVGVAAAKNDLENVAGRAVKSLERVGRASAEKGLKRVTREAVESLGEVGKAAAEKGLEDATGQAAGSLEDVGKTTAEKGLGDATSQAVKSLGAILTVAIEKGLQSVAIFTAVHLENIAKAAIKNDLEAAPVKAAMSLMDAGTTAVKKDRNPVPGVAVSCLKDVGTAAAAKKGFELATLMTASGLIILGLATAAKREFKYETEQAAEALAELTILSEEIVKTAIHDFESTLKEKDRDSFQKFKNLYEKKLEKLQAEQKDSE